MSSVSADALDYSHRLDDELMRFFEHCRGYVEAVENNRTALVEMERFKHGEEVEGVRRRVAEKLGLPVHRLTPGEKEITLNYNSQHALVARNDSVWECGYFN